MITEPALILTGAGFTKNFGGYLSSEMWQRIFNNPLIQGRDKLKKLLLDNFDFEGVYSEVVTKEAYSKEEKEILKKAVEEAYKSQDDGMKFPSNSDNDEVYVPSLGKIFAPFAGGAGERKGVMFTLNQDLFMERRFNYLSPGVKFPEEFYRGSRQLTPVTLPKEEEMEQIKERAKSHGAIWYVKLHGSYGWLSANQQNQMVLGKNKKQDIAKEPLLKWYFEIFTDAIKEDGKKLLIIGYSFRDEHINKILIDGVKNHGLKLYILTPTDPQVFKNNLYAYVRDGLWEGVRGYFSCTVRELLRNGYEPEQLKEIFRTLKGT